MYLYDRQQTGARRMLPHQFGEAVPSHKGLILLDHYHVPKYKMLVPVTLFSFQEALVPGQNNKLDAKGMNPGFIDQNDKLTADSSNDGLQTCLSNLITTKFQNFLAGKQNKVPSSNDRLRVGVVDLTGDKLIRPDFAGWGSTLSMYGASVPKVLALYAAYQLRKDLNHLAVAQKITNGITLNQTAIQKWKEKGLNGGFPNLEWLFDIQNWRGAKPLDFTSEIRGLFVNIFAHNNNQDAGKLIIRIGFPYIASVAWQSGLHHPERGGLWLSDAYGMGKWGAGNIQHPEPVWSHNVTALSAATFFTLLAQGRLVDDASSNEIKDVLNDACAVNLPVDELGVEIPFPSKCGYFADYLHNSALVKRGHIRYVVVVLANLKQGEDEKYRQVFLELDKLIVRNNQAPKPAC